MSDLAIAVKVLKAKQKELWAKHKEADKKWDASDGEDAEQGELSWWYEHEANKLENAIVTLLETK